MRSMQISIVRNPFSIVLFFASFLEQLRNNHEKSSEALFLKLLETAPPPPP